MRPWAFVVGVALFAAVSWRQRTGPTSSTTTGAKLFDAALAANATAPLTARGLRNEIAFTRLFGYVRYFHPSDESAAADWEALAVQGARTVEAADDDTALAKALAALFQPVSPTLRNRLRARTTRRRPS